MNCINLDSINHRQVVENLAILAQGNKKRRLMEALMKLNRQGRKPFTDKEESLSSLEKVYQIWPFKYHIWKLHSKCDTEQLFFVDISVYCHLATTFCQKRLIFLL